jgi:hypothetical protein
MPARTEKSCCKAVLSSGILFVLTACGAVPIKTETVTVEVPVYVPLPSELTEPVPEPEVDVRVWDDIVEAYEQMRAALRLANERLRKIGEASKGG